MTDAEKALEDARLAEEAAAKEAEGDDAIVKTPEEIEAEAQATADAEAKAEADKLAAAEAGETGEGGEPTELDVIRNEMAELRSGYATAGATIKALENQLAEQNKVLVEAGHLDELDASQQAEADKAADARKIYLEGIFEVMTLNPKYEDMGDVITEVGKEAVIKAYTEQLIENNPEFSVQDADLAVRQTIAGHRNPYKFYYDNIKILASDSEKDVKEAKDLAEVKKKALEATNAPGSVGNMGAGGADGKSGWTMSKLDAMSEDAMEKAGIPADILEKHLAGTLPE